LNRSLLAPVFLCQALLGPISSRAANRAPDVTFPPRSVALLLQHSSVEPPGTGDFSLMPVTGRFCGESPFGDRPLKTKNTVCYGNHRR
jgi:hypothetical protein